MPGTPIPLSASVGGSRILLDTAALPGKLIHENPTDSGENHLVADLLVVNPNSTAITLWLTIVGPGITPPPAQDQQYLVRVDVQPTAEGNEPRLFYTPFILAPGYSCYISTTVLAGQVPGYILGYVEASSLTPNGGGGAILGYGGLIQQAGFIIASIPSSTWVTIQFDDGMVTSPNNVTQDPANNRFKVDAPGVYYASAYGVFLCDKVGGGNDRALFTRFFNETDGTPLTTSPFPLFVEDQNNNGLWSYATYFEVPQVLVGKWIRQEIGGSVSAFSDVEVKKAGITVTRVNDTI